MVLVDTSVWNRFLSNRMPYATDLDDLLRRRQVAGHDLIYGELLMGNSSNRSELLLSYGLIYRLSNVAHSDVVRFVRERNLQGRGIGWIDAHLIASALVAGTPLWTADERLAQIARQLEICYSTNDSRG